MDAGHTLKHKKMSSVGAKEVSNLATKKWSDYQALGKSFGHLLANVLLAFCKKGDEDKVKWFLRGLIEAAEKKQKKIAKMDK